MSARRNAGRNRDMYPMKKTFEEALAAGKRSHTFRISGDPWGGYDAYTVHDDFVIKQLGPWFCVDYFDAGRTYRDGTKKVQWDKEKQRWTVSEWQGCAA